jgi:hypothetical protein
MCAEAFGVEEHRLVGASRLQEIVIPRHATFYVLRRRFPDMSYPRIGRFMGGRDHSTILHGIRNIEERMKRDDALRHLVQSLVRGRIPVQADAHVMIWRLQQQPQRKADQRIARARVIVTEVVPADSDLAEFVDTNRTFCGQCDRAVTLIEAAGCKSARCGAKLVGQVGFAA